MRALLLATSALALVLALLWLARRAFRRAVRDELVAYLREAHPQVEVAGRPGDDLLLRAEGAQGRLNLDKVYGAVAALQPDSAQARREVFAGFAGSLLGDLAESTRPLTLERDGHRVLPRLVPPSFLAALPAADLPQRPLAETGLAVVYVLDAPRSVSYLARERLAELGLGEDALHARAMANLAARFPDEQARPLFTSGALNVVKTLDGHDAARLLLLPGYLRGDEVVAAAVPDRDTLVIAAVPPDGDWSRLRKVAKAAAGPPLCARPLRVTRAGIELA